jgi:hypothetical protein
MRNGIELAAVKSWSTDKVEYNIIQFGPQTAGMRRAMGRRHRCLNWTNSKPLVNWDKRGATPHCRTPLNIFGVAEDI